MLRVSKLESNEFKPMNPERISTTARNRSLPPETSLSVMKDAKNFITKWKSDAPVPSIPPFLICRGDVRPIPHNTGHKNSGSRNEALQLCVIDLLVPAER
jgi:hypothetical protein